LVFHNTYSITNVIYCLLFTCGRCQVKTRNLPTHTCNHTYKTPMIHTCKPWGMKEKQQFVSPPIQGTHTTNHSMHKCHTHRPTYNGCFDLRFDVDMHIMYVLYILCVGLICTYDVPRHCSHCDQPTGKPLETSFYSTCFNNYKYCTGDEHTPWNGHVTKHNMSIL